jgi:hypothetical protein
VIKKFAINTLLFLFVFPFFAYAQDAIDSLESSDTATDFDRPEMVTETIKVISASKRIFIISNENKFVNKGDFITMILSDKRAARALIAKTEDSSAGIKILKIYSVPHWNLFRKGLEVGIIKGDDSYYKAVEKEKKEDLNLVNSEEDLFNDTNLDDGDDLDENDKRHIKTDNIITLSLGRVEGLNVDGASQRYNQFIGSWSYQLVDNIWGDFSYGETTIDNYPSDNLSTKLTNLTLKFKYTIAAPLYSYLQPYVGYQILSASSPEAGNSATTGTDDLRRVDNLEKKSFVIGVSILKRLVPGWFVRGDLGTDIISIGFGLEF